MKYDLYTITRTPVALSLDLGLDEFETHHFIATFEDEDKANLVAATFPDECIVKPYKATGPDLVEAMAGVANCDIDTAFHEVESHLSDGDCQECFDALVDIEQDTINRVLLERNLRN